MFQPSIVRAILSQPQPSKHEPGRFYPKGGLLRQIATSADLGRLFAQAAEGCKGKSKRRRKSVLLGAAEHYANHAARLPYLQAA